MGRSERDIKNICKAKVAKGLSINGSRAANSGDSIKKWLKQNGLV